MCVYIDMQQKHVLCNLSKGVLIYFHNNIKNLKLQLRRSEEGWFNNKPSAGQMILSYKMSPGKDHTFRSQAVILQVQQVSTKTGMHHL